MSRLVRPLSRRLIGPRVLAFERLSDLAPQPLARYGALGAIALRSDRSLVLYAPLELVGFHAGSLLVDSESQVALAALNVRRIPRDTAYGTHRFRSTWADRPRSGFPGARVAGGDRRCRALELRVRVRAVR